MYIGYKGKNFTNINIKSNKVYVCEVLCYNKIKVGDDNENIL